MIREFLRWSVSDPSRRFVRLTLVAITSAALILSAWLIINKVLS